MDNLQMLNLLAEIMQEIETKTNNLSDAEKIKLLGNLVDSLQDEIDEIEDSK